MIRIDTRQGSGELSGLFTPFGLAPERVKLEFGDLEFSGQGPKGECMVAVERKRISDLINSITDNRLAGHQLQGMAKTYDCIYLIIEGLWRLSNGHVEIRDGTVWHRAPIDTRRLNGFLTTLEMKAGIVVRRTLKPEETVSMVVDLYRWWQQPWADHKSHEAVYTIQPSNSNGHRMVSLIPREVSLVERVALQLPGLAERAKFAAQRWPTVRSMMRATEEDWADMPWTDKNGKERRLGEAVAAKVIGAINGSKGDR